MPPRLQHQPTSEPSTDTPSVHECTQRELLERLEAKIDTINERLAQGSVVLATSGLRLMALEAITYGGCGVALLYTLTKTLGA